MNTEFRSLEGKQEQKIGTHLKPFYLRSLLCLICLVTPKSQLMQLSVTLDQIFSKWIGFAFKGVAEAIKITIT